MIRATLHSLITSFKIASQALIIISILLYSLSIAKGAGTWNYIGNYNGGNCDLTFYFTIGQKGYVGGGRTSISIFKSDFWEFNPTNNTWTQLADYLGGDKGQQIAFASPVKGYVGLGFDGNAFFNDFYEYNPLTNIWSQKATFPGSGRYSSLSFYINGYGYVATGFDGNPKKMYGSIILYQIHGFKKIIFQVHQGKAQMVLLLERPDIY
ncbi:MAG: hypothetical protein IPP34_00180 [Bacteroidetes bacterium]|nr:hypothetical protein [Bacteroidota bacterium]